MQSNGDKEAGLYSYQAQGGYVGKDTFTVGVDTMSKSRVKITYSLQFKVSVVESITNDQYPSTCEKNNAQDTLSKSKTEKVGVFEFLHSVTYLRKLPGVQPVQHLNARWNAA